MTQLHTKHGTLIHLIKTSERYHNNYSTASLKAYATTKSNITHQFGPTNYILFF